MAAGNSWERVGASLGGLAAPKDAVANAAWRSVLAEYGGRSAECAEELRELCRAEPLFWLNSFCVTYDPRLEGEKVIPFVAYDVQERLFLKLLASVRKQESLVIEKSRDMGASWLCLYAILYLAGLFRGFTFMVLSKKGDAARKREDTDSLFWKLLFAVRMMPPWLFPEMRSVAGHIGFPANVSSIDAENSVEAAGVGGRRSMILFDEFARFPDAHAAYRGTKDTTGCRVFNFTPWGTATKAYELSRMVAEGAIPGFRMHWSEHPGKAKGLYRWPVRGDLQVMDAGYGFEADYPFVRDGKLRSPWYDRYCREMRDERAVAENLDIDYLASKHQFYSTDRIRELMDEYCRPPVWVGDVVRGELLPMDGGPLSLWINPVMTGSGAANVTVPRGRYAMGADVAHGVGATPSCLTVANMETGEKVAAYVSATIDPQTFADVAMAIGRLFAGPEEEGGGPARLLWERAGPGEVFAKRVVAECYGNVGQPKAEGRWSVPSTDTPGWVPTQASKLTLHSDYRGALYTRQFQNRCEFAMEECLRYVFQQDGTIEHDASRNPSDPSSGRSNHGDRVVADALAWKLIADAQTMRAAKTRPAEEDIRLNPPVLSLAYRRKMAETADDDGDAVWV